MHPLYNSLWNSQVMLQLTMLEAKTRYRKFKAKKKGENNIYWVKALQERIPNYNYLSDMRKSNSLTIGFP